mmetsp:Transcript_21110/g.49410  ORF Transcript_21110/g.49410 Transcript_21110/m.49410 type:complete len:250 (+) Transcript_21110:690-1439(+)
MATTPSTETPASTGGPGSWFGAFQCLLPYTALLMMRPPPLTRSSRSRRTSYMLRISSTSLIASRRACTVASAFSSRARSSLRLRRRILFGSMKANLAKEQSANGTSTAAVTATTVGASANVIGITRFCPRREKLSFHWIDPSAPIAAATPTAELSVNLLLIPASAAKCSRLPRAPANIDDLVDISQFIFALHDASPVMRTWVPRSQLNPGEIVWLPRSFTPGMPPICSPNLPYVDFPICLVNVRDKSDR